MNGNIECAAFLTVSSDVKARTAQSGKRWLSFLARSGNGEDAQWAQVAVFGDAAKALEGKLAKGGRVYVEGSIKLNSWQSGQGEARSGLSIAAWRCELVGQIGRQKPRKAAGQAEGPRRQERPALNDALPF